MGGVSTATDERLIAAHRALRADGELQFSMVPAAGPPPTPAWLKAFGEWMEHVLAPVGRFFWWISSFMPDAPYAKIILWSLIAAAAVLLLWTIYDRVRHGVWQLPRLPRRRFATAAQIGADDTWSPKAAPARAWLKEADALAAQGRFADAVHHLLMRSVEDLARRRPQIVRPALTSRELAAIEAIPSAPRRLFAEIATVVERSLFGERPVNADEWALCRSAYTNFAQPRSWAG
ncbi:DUF4129 domain-containing protein [Sphingobium sp. SCG-1]|uniref:DUF4129 domain-containing protein n=1 Tax=Sphingobium sp. SCG-1 TaxID=2072936 RepID=UPI000CD67A6F|nr:DUF4129 domain-containing protein [Sphingobium sp. SCG-1]AUW58210.1 DUF4129 domain-containing protein [Sphingobium sp. SCG-1]